MTRVLVTGAAGFIGSHLVDHLVDQGHDVCGVDDMSGGFWRNINPKSHFTRLDLRNTDATRIYIESVRPEIIFHMAADATEGRSQFTPIECTGRNYMAYLNVLAPAITCGLERMILASSISVYGSQLPPFSEDMPRRPDDIYGISKASMETATEILSQVHGFTYTIIRPHNVYGPRQNMADPYRNVVGIFINRLLQGKHFYIYGDGEQKRAFTYIDDLVPYVAKAAFLESCAGQIFNLGPREEVTINYLAETILSLFFDSQVPDHMRPQYLPPRPQEVKEAYCTTDKAEAFLGYKTSVHLEEGIQRMLVWARELGPQQSRYLLHGLEISNEQVPQTWREQLL